MRAHPAGPRHADVLPHDPIYAPPADLARLEPAIWPQGAARNADGELTLAGTAISQLVDTHSTPLVVLDEQDFRDRARDYAQAFDGADVFYAGKAFLCKAVARWVAQEGLHLDVCTGGELAVALAAGFDPSRLALHGNNKSVAELRQALEVGVGRIVIDSMNELDRLDALCAEMGVTAHVLIRITVGVEAHTHEFIATAHEDQKFGFSLANGAADAAIARAVNSAHLHLLGVHSHIGSQIFDTAGFEVSAHRMVQLLAQVAKDHQIELEELDLGGGLGIAYVAGDKPAQVRDIAESLRLIVRRECELAGIAVPRLSVEPGRALIGPAGVTLYEVGTVKPVELGNGMTRTYVSVDGGISDNIRTALYDADYTCIVANRVSQAPAVLSRVVGKHCESGDVVVKDVWLPGDVRPGDVLAVAATGAYCRSMASNYNHVPRPAVVAIKDGHSQVVVRRETLDDLLRLDVG
ncbi:MAG: diaminopimelate decarboxylase [Corynebacteriales bacterium]|nr:diaminopimelate decarboxylase [Mycobacteriales bacterium]